MYFRSIFLSILSITFVNAHCDESPAQYNDNNIQSIDEQVEPLGTDNVFCLFTYGNWVMPAAMQQDIPNAIYSGVARLPHYRLDFNHYSPELKGSFPTIAPDCGQEVWGSIYLIPVQDLDTVLLKGGVANDQKIYHFVQAVVEAYSSEIVINVKCNVFQQIDLPEKLIYGLPLPQDRRPSQQILDILTEAYQDGGLPQKYIEEVSQIPTTEQGYIEMNQSQQNHVAIVGPDSVTVAPKSTVVNQYQDSQIRLDTKQSQDQQTQVLVNPNQDSQIQVGVNQKQNERTQVRVIPNQDSQMQVDTYQNQDQQTEVRVNPNQDSQMQVGVNQNQNQRTQVRVNPNQDSQMQLDTYQNQDQQTQVRVNPNQDSQMQVDTYQNQDQQTQVRVNPNQDSQMQVGVNQNQNQRTQVRVNPNQDSQTQVDVGQNQNQNTHVATGAVPPMHYIQEDEPEYNQAYQ